MIGDPRTTPARADVAAASLQGTVTAERFADGAAHCVAVAVVPMRAAPDRAAPLATELLAGEEIFVYDLARGWAWGQATLDLYVGYLPAEALTPAGGPAPTHRVWTLASQIYAAPELKLPPIGRLSFGARVVVAKIAGGYASVGPGQFVPVHHLCPLDDPEPDWVETARRFLGLPYVWGGRSGEGVDCSSLVQLALQAAGRKCPRDSDMQEAALGTTLAVDAPLARGDLVFWRGHVAIVTGPDTLLHANAYHMAVVEEPLGAAIRRIAEAGGGAVTRRARLDAGGARQ